MRGAALFALAGALSLLVPLTAGAARQPSTKHTYVVLYEHGATPAKARAAIKRAGGLIVRENRKVGVATVRSANARFVTLVARSGAVYGAARRAVRGPAVGHADDPRDVRRVLQAPAWQPERAGGGHRHRRRRVAPGHRAEPTAR